MSIITVRNIIFNYHILVYKTRVHFYDLGSSTDKSATMYDRTANMAVFKSNESGFSTAIVSASVW